MRRQQLRQGCDTPVMNALKCRTLGATRVQILKSARATEMRVTESIRKICEQKTGTKEKDARCLTLSHIPGSVQPTVSLVKSFRKLCRRKVAQNTTAILL